MIDDSDIWRAANLLVKRHGADAALTAARRADEMLAAGGVESCAIWKRILEAVAELTRTAPAPGRASQLSPCRR
jgi:triphosphoribosyl-dephospho-CoA synthetase